MNVNDQIQKILEFVQEQINNPEGKEPVFQSGYVTAACKIKDYIVSNTISSSLDQETFKKICHDLENKIPDSTILDTYKINKVHLDHIKGIVSFVNTCGLLLASSEDKTHH